MRIPSPFLPRMVPARGDTLDRIGELHGVHRRTYFFFFREWDCFYRKRVLSAARGMFR